MNVTSQVGKQRVRQPSGHQMRGTGWRALGGFGGERRTRLQRAGAHPEEVRSTSPASCSSHTLESAEFISLRGLVFLNRDLLRVSRPGLCCEHSHASWLLTVLCRSSELPESILISEGCQHSHYNPQLSELSVYLSHFKSQSLKHSLESPVSLPHDLSSNSCFICISNVYLSSAISNHINWILIAPLLLRYLHFTKMS